MPEKRSGSLINFFYFFLLQNNDDRNEDDDDLEDELDLDDDLKSEMGESRSDRLSEHGMTAIDVVVAVENIVVVLGENTSVSVKIHHEYLSLG